MAQWTLMHDNLVMTLPMINHQPHGPAFTDIQVYTIYASVYHDLAICHLFDPYKIDQVDSRNKDMGYSYIIQEMVINNLLLLGVGVFK